MVRIRVIKKFPFTRYPKILLKGNKEINLDISEPKHWSKYHEMSST